MNPYPFLLALCLAASTVVQAQKVLQVERIGSPQTQKIHTGETIEYRLRGEEEFRLGYIEGFNVADSLIVLGDRYLHINDIGALRFQRPTARQAGRALMIFGASWTAIGATGSALDNNPDTVYDTQDVIISGTALALGYAIDRIFRNRVKRIGRKFRLRLLDLNIYPEP